MGKIVFKRPGWRILKTGLSLFICLIIYHFLFHRTNPMVACLATIFALRENTTSSVSFGKARIISNGCGGLMAFLCILIVYYPNYHYIKEVIFVPLALMLFIYLMTLIKNQSGIISGSAALLMIFFTSLTNEPLVSVCFRFADTIVGTLIAIFVNHFIHPMKKPTVQEQKQALKAQINQLQQKYEELEE